MPTPTIDFSIFDGQMLVTYEPAGQTPIADISAIRRPLTQSRQRNVERYIELMPTDEVFHLDAAPLTNATLSAGDTLTGADATVYEVLFVERQTLNRTVAAVCRATS